MPAKTSIPFKVNAYNELEATLDENPDYKEPAIEEIVPRAYTRKKPKEYRAVTFLEIEGRSYRERHSF